MQLRRAMRFIAFSAGLTLSAVGGCCSSHYADYRVVVVEDDAAGYRFDPAPNPEGLQPVDGASLALVLDGETKAEAVTDVTGRGDLAASFECQPVDRIEVQVAAAGREPFTYVAAGDGSEPRDASSLFLNVKLRPE